MSIKKIPKFAHFHFAIFGYFYINISIGWSVLGVSKAIENSAPVKFMKVAKNHIIENQVVYLAVLGMVFTYVMYSFIKKKINNAPVEEKEERREVIMGLEE